MERTYKSWGEKWNIFQNDLCEVSILYLRPQQRCSWHRHQAKYNQFFVIAGELAVKMVDGIARLSKGQIFTTRPMEWHEFQTGDSRAVVQEIMYVCYDPEDIEREKIGGPLKAEFVHTCPKCGCAAVSGDGGDFVCCSYACGFKAPEIEFNKRAGK